MMKKVRLKYIEFRKIFFWYKEGKDISLIIVIFILFGIYGYYLIFFLIVKKNLLII